MLELDQQLHGYQHGHQLLSASISLPKIDQMLVDRLSDVAGPLGPGERFEPYLSFYPLPSGTHYVIARTWQDLDVPRAGCVRTRSLLVSMSKWVELVDISSVVDAVTEFGPTESAVRVKVDVVPFTSLPPVKGSIGLLEALFLEDREPIVVFDAEQPDLVTVRLITAFWPGLRRNFSASTFARSPRMIQRGSFDLVFAPKEARSRFSNWSGRRIDGRRSEQARHRWSNTIAEKVFLSPSPSLRSLDTLGEMAADESGAEAALRITLLWDELQSKLKTSPNAALGLLDIANTRETRNVRAIQSLEPALARATRQATVTMPPKDAWRFLEALADKLQELPLTLSVANEIRSATVDLAAAHPFDAVARIAEFARVSQRRILIEAAGDGIARVLEPAVSVSLRELDSKDLLDISLASPTLTEKLLNLYPEFSRPLAVAIAGSSESVRDEAMQKMLKHLVTDEHADLARIFFGHLDASGLCAEVGHLYEVSGLAAPVLRNLVIDQAKHIGADVEVRETAVALGDEEGVAYLVAGLMSPSALDISWAISSSHLTSERRLSMVSQLIMRATKEELHEMFSEDHVLSKTLNLLTTHVSQGLDALSKIANQLRLECATFISLALILVPHLEGEKKRELTEKALEAALPQELGSFGGDMLGALMQAMGKGLNATKTIRLGLQHSVSGSVVSRNLIAFNELPSAPRSEFLMAVEEIARRLADRGRVDISSEGALAASAILEDSENLSHQAFIRACANLLPSLLRSPRDPISALIAVTFPPVYRELKRESVPDYLGFIFIFLDWDRCKSAQRELVNAFMKSDWRAIDIALAAVRAGDAQRIIKHIVRQRDGKRAIIAIERDLQLVPSPWKDEIKMTISDIKRTGSSRDDLDI